VRKRLILLSIITHTNTHAYYMRAINFIISM